MYSSWQLRIVGLLTCVVALLLPAGCPTVVTGDVYTPLVLADGGTSYIDDMFINGKLMRWSQKEITVSLDTSQIPAEWQVYAEYYVVDGLEQWEQASDGAFTFVGVGEDADITVQYVHSIPSPTGLIGGSTSVEFTATTFSRPRVLLAIDNLTDVQMHASAIHELGHALGLMGHSPNATDVMAAGTYTTELTPNDIATLLDIYRRPAELTVAGG